MPGPPLVSIALPTYNRAAFLEETLPTLLAQDHPGFELVILDNGSTDNTPDVLRHFAAQDPRIVLHRHEHNVGVLNAHNGIVDLCRGTYVIFAGDDDPWLPHRLSTLLSLMAPGVSVVYSDWHEINVDGTPFRSSLPRHPPNSSRPLPGFHRHCRLVDVRMTLGLMPRELVAGRQLFRGFRDNYGWFSDGWFTCFLLTHGEVRYSPEKTFTKRWLTTKSYGQDSATHQDLLDKVQQLLWVSREAHEQVRSAVKSPLRRIAFRWGYGGFLREKLSWLFRLYPWLISQDPQQYRRLVTEAEAYRRRERIAEGGAVLWWLAHVWPPVRSAAKALRRALRPTSA